MDTEKHSLPQKQSTPGMWPVQKLRLITYNIQVGISTSRYHHYLTHSWKHFLPHARSFENLDSTARLLHDYDIVALQEADAGSFRSFFINQIEYLARRGHFPYWYYQTNRNLGKLAQHSNGLLSKYLPSKIIEHKLPGFIPGRGVMEVHYGSHDNPFVIILVHLALAKRARKKQLAYISQLVSRYQHVVVMGDFNCGSRSEEMDRLLYDTHLCEPLEKLHTFPSWQPNRNIDHILVTPSVKINSLEVLSHNVSDHLPITVEIDLPGDIEIKPHMG